MTAIGFDRYAKRWLKGRKSVNSATRKASPLVTINKQPHFFHLIQNFYSEERSFMGCTSRF